MAPEFPVRLAVLDLSVDGDELAAKIDYVEGGDEDVPLTVLWTIDAEGVPPGYLAVGGGVVCVKNADGVVVVRAAERASIDRTDGETWAWTQGMPSKASLMVAMVLPAGYTLANSRPLPIRAKEHRGRIAVYYFVDADRPTGRVRLSWSLAKIVNPNTADAEVVTLNKRCIKVSPAAANVVVPEPEPAKEAQADSTAVPTGSAAIPSWFPSAAFLIGVGFILLVLILVTAVPNAPPQTYVMYRIVMALGAAGFAMGTTGFLVTNISFGKAVSIIASGSLAVFVIVFFWNPASGPALRGESQASPTSLDVTHDAAKHEQHSSDDVVNRGNGPAEPDQRSSSCEGSDLSDASFDLCRDPIDYGSISGDYGAVSFNGTDRTYHLSEGDRAGQFELIGGVVIAWAGNQTFCWKPTLCGRRLRLVYDEKTCVADAVLKENGGRDFVNIQVPRGCRR